MTGGISWENTVLLYIYISENKIFYYFYNKETFYLREFAKVTFFFSWSLLLVFKSLRLLLTLLQMSPFPPTLPTPTQPPPLLPSGHHHPVVCVCGWYIYVLWRCKISDVSYILFISHIFFLLNNISFSLKMVHILFKNGPYHKCLARVRE